jgi:hypothetical protein
MDPMRLQEGSHSVDRLLASTESCIHFSEAQMLTVLGGVRIRDVIKSLPELSGVAKLESECERKR